MIHIIILVVALIRDRLEERRFRFLAVAPDSWIAALNEAHPIDME